VSSVRPGAIVAEGVSRRFRVYAERPATLKEAVVRRRRAKAIEIWALRDVSFQVEPGESVGLIGRNGSGKTTLLRLAAGIFEPTGGRIDTGGSVGALLALGAGFHPDFTGRENIFLAGSILGLPRRYIREQLDEIVAFAELEQFVDLPVRTYSAGMHMRLGFSVATHLRPDILLLDEVFAVGDEAFRRKCVGKIFEIRARGGTIVYVSHDAGSVERLCERTILLSAGRLEHDGATHEAIAQYHRMLATEEDPEERSAGLREWGTREIRVAALRLEDAAGVEREQFLAGEALAVRLDLVAEHRLAPPWLTIEVRDDNGGLLGASVQDAAVLGWDPGAVPQTVMFTVDRLPFSDGRFRLSVAVADGPGGRLYHRVEDALRFVVYPDREHVRGAIRVDGRWALAEEATGVGAASG
jgi:ABC-type polysaccharide/polyol phosphate transport system ATPase subunit